MTIAEHNVAKLREIKTLLIKFPTELYTEPKEILKGATIGQHIRHILEFFICLEKGLNTPLSVNYLHLGLQFVHLLE